MYELDIKSLPQAVNLELFNAEVLALGVAGFEGLAVRGEKILAVFVTQPRGADVARIEAAARTHDHRALTPVQQKEKEETDKVAAKRAAILSAAAPRSPQQIDDAIDAIVIILRRNGLL